MITFPRKAEGGGRRRKGRPERQVIEVYYEATPRTFAALVDECTGANVHCERLAEWLYEREISDSPLLEARLKLEAQLCSK